MNLKCKLAIFDLDGTLFDTSEVNFLAYLNASATFGFNIDKTIFYEQFFKAKNYKEFLPLLGVRSIDDIENIHEEKKKIYSEYIKYAKPNRLLLDFIASIRNDYYIAMATTASRKNTADILKAFDVFEYFDFIIAQEDVSKLKPDPECFLKAMNRVNILPDKTMVFEDSEAGLQAAAKSGASVFKVVQF